jgi:hypothetical protein
MQSAKPWTASPAIFWNTLQRMLKLQTPNLDKPKKDKVKSQSAKVKVKTLMQAFTNSVRIVFKN